MPITPSIGQLVWRPLPVDTDNSPRVGRITAFDSEGSVWTVKYNHTPGATEGDAAEPVAEAVPDAEMTTAFLPVARYPGDTVPGTIGQLRLKAAGDPEVPEFGPYYVYVLQALYAVVEVGLLDPFTGSVNAGPSAINYRIIYGQILQLCYNAAGVGIPNLVEGGLRITAVVSEDEGTGNWTPITAPGPGLTYG